MTGGEEHGVEWIPELVKFLNLGAIVALVYVFGRKGISASLKTRSEDISKKIVDAKVELERMQFEADRARKEIADITNTKEKLVEEMRESGIKAYEAMIADAKSAAARIVEDAKLAADNEVQSAVSKVKKDIVDQAVLQALKLANESNGHDTKGTLHEKLVERFISNMKDKEGLGHGL